MKMTERHNKKEATIDIFEQRAIRFQKEYPEESKRLAGELLVWASAVSSSGTLGETVASQIDYQVNQHRKEGDKITTEEYIDMLFSLNPKGIINSDIIMARLQLG